MEERIIVVKEITTKQTAKGNDYLSVKGKDGHTYNIFDQASFPAFEIDKAVKLSGETAGKFFNTTKAEKVANIMEQKAAQAVAEKMNASTPEEGMWWKELGEMLRAGDIDKTKPMGKALRDFYYTQMLSVLDITLESTHGE